MAPDYTKSDLSTFAYKASRSANRSSDSAGAAASYAHKAENSYREAVKLARELQAATNLPRLDENGNLSIPGSVSTNTITAADTVTANTFLSTGNISASGSISASMLTVTGAATFNGRVTLNGGATIVQNASANTDVANYFSASAAASVLDAFRDDCYISNSNSTITGGGLTASSFYPGAYALKLNANSKLNARLYFSGLISLMSYPRRIGGMLRSYIPYFAASRDYVKILFVIGKSDSSQRTTTSVDDFLVEVPANPSADLLKMTRYIEITVYKLGTAYEDLVPSNKCAIRVREVWGDHTAGKWMMTTTISSYPNASSNNTLRDTGFITWQYDKYGLNNSGALWMSSHSYTSDLCFKIADLHPQVDRYMSYNQYIYIEAPSGTSTSTAIIGKYTHVFQHDANGANPTYHGFKSIETNRIIGEPVTEEFTAFSDL